jgi:leukotriene-A4 hydrolase
MTRFLAFLLTSLAVMTAHAAPDPHSYANHDQIRLSHAHLELDVRFDTRTLAGFVEWDLERLDAAASTLVLDTRDLTINEVLAMGRDRRYVQAAFQLAPRDAIFGQALSIRLPEGATRVRIRYETSPEASGLKWLPPELTADKAGPFLFSQAQAIHARSFVPLQDTPAVRFTYSARITTPKGLLARMSAANDPLDAADGDYRFRRDQPIPSYLLALAVGRMDFAPIGERSGVYAEPSLLERAAYEFADTERMIEVAESLYGPYRWGRYDLLVLPPAFPFGGMENPRLTFLTQTVIAGDRSLVALIAHELAHSWSGNLVTNAGWEHIWLNEGFTTYVENRIVEALFGAERADMERALSEGDLIAEMADLPESEQRFRISLAGRDPDDGLTEVPYTRGMLFLRTLEQRFGREVFDPFLRAWFDHKAFESADTDDFLAFLRKELIARHPGKFSEAEIAAFVDRGGYPDFAPRTQATRFTAIDAVARDWLAGTLATDAIDSGAWSTQEWLHFIEALPAELPVARFRELDGRFELRASGNSEIAFAWYMRAIALDDREVLPAIEAFLERVGRRKFVLPLYEAMMKQEGQRAFARATYAKFRANYHPITQASVDAVMDRGGQP